MRAERAHLVGVERLHRRLRPDGHERRRRDRAVRGLEDPARAAPSVAVTRNAVNAAGSRLVPTPREAAGPWGHPSPPPTSSLLRGSARAWDTRSCRNRVARAARWSQRQHRVAEGVEAIALRDRGPVERPRLLHPDERHHEREQRRARGRWKFVSSASTRRNSNPGVTKSRVRPESSPVRATVSSVRTVVVPTGEDAVGGGDPPPRGRLHGVALAVELVILDARARTPAGRCPRRRGA